MLAYFREVFGNAGAVSCGCGLVMAFFAIRYTVRLISDFEFFSKEFEDADTRVNIQDMDDAVTNKKVRLACLQGKTIVRLLSILQHLHSRPLRYFRG